jgi:hypothetical protein
LHVPLLSHPTTVHDRCGRLDLRDRTSEVVMPLLAAAPPADRAPEAARQGHGGIVDTVFWKNR